MTASRHAFGDKVYRPSKFTLWTTAESKTHPKFLLVQPVALLFDSSVSSSSSSAQARISLEAFDTQQAEVSFCKWSPCGTYVAVGRNDDRVDLFDSRFIKYGPVSRMVHGEPIKRTPWKVLWGITGLEWVEGAGNGQQALVSGGTDGRCYGSQKTCLILRLQVLYDYGTYVMPILFAISSPKWRRMLGVSRWVISANEKPRWSCE